MTVRARYSVASAISSNSAEDKDLGNAKYEVVSDGTEKGGTWKTVLLASATNVQLYFDNITTIRYFLIRISPKNPNEVAAEVTIKRNSTGAEPISIKALPNSKEGHFLLTTDALTSVYASNLGSVDMELVVSACGT